MTPDEIEKDRAPERIWIDHERTYSATFFSAGIEYTRSDLFDVLTAERDDALALVAAAYEAAIDEVVMRLFVPFTAQARYVTKHKSAMISDLTATYVPADALAAQAARDERMRAEGAREAEARIARLTEALKHLDRAATEVIRYGAQTGPQWTRITAASLKARAALRENGD